MKTEQTYKGVDFLSDEDKKAFKNLVELDEVRGMKIVCNEEHKSVFDKKKNDCIKKIVCENCSRFVVSKTKTKSWYCCSEPYEDWLKKRVSIKNSQPRSLMKSFLHENLIYEGRDIPDFCNKILEHRVFSQEEM